MIILRTKKGNKTKVNNRLIPLDDKLFTDISLEYKAN
jgi:hypothetical protein